MPPPDKQPIEPDVTVMDTVMQSMTFAAVVMALVIIGFLLLYGCAGLRTTPDFNDCRHASCPRVTVKFSDGKSLDVCADADLEAEMRQYNENMRDISEMTGESAPLIIGRIR